MHHHVQEADREAEPLLLRQAALHGRSEQRHRREAHLQLRRGDGEPPTCPPGEELFHPMPAWQCLALYKGLMPTTAKSQVLCSHLIVTLHLVLK